MFRAIKCNTLKYTLQVFANQKKKKKKKKKKEQE